MDKDEVTFELSRSFAFSRLNTITKKVRGRFNTKNCGIVKTYVDSLQPIEVYHPLICKAPVPWHQHFLISRQFCEHNLFVLHEISLYIRNAWENRGIFKYFNVLRASFSSELSDVERPDVVGFVDRIKKDCMTIHLDIDKWIGVCAQILRDNKECWKTLTPNNASETIRRIQNFFNSLATLQALQIRFCIESILDTWMSDLDEFLEKDGKSVTPVPIITLQVKLQGENLQFSYSHDEFFEAISSVLISLIEISLNHPRIENVLFSEMQHLKEHLSGFGIDEARAEKIKAKLTMLTQKTFTEMNIALTSYKGTIERVEYLSSQKIYTYLDGEHHFQSFDVLVKEIKMTLQEIALLPKFFHLSFVSINCVSVKEKLYQKLITYQNSLINHQFDQHRSITKGLASEFETIALEVNQVVDKTKDIVVLLDSVKFHQEHSMRRLKIGVARSGNRMIHLLNHMDFKDQDTFLHCRLFSWPRDLDELLAVSKKRIQRVKKEAEETLRQRTSVLLNRVIRIENELEEFRRKDPPVLTIEDMKRTSSAVDLLVYELEKASADLKDINENEENLGWEPTAVKSLAVLRQNIDPYHRLWHISLDFTLKNRRWSYGPLAGLEYKAIFEEIESMYKVIYKLCKNFSDNPGPRRVAQTIRVQMEKFRSHLPLLAIVCNPGLRKRHWNTIAERTKQDMTKSSEASLADLVSLGLSLFAHNLSDIGETATKEAELEETLERMKSEWRSIKFNCIPYGHQGAYILGHTEDIRSLIDEHLLRSQAMHSSLYIAPLELELHEWELTLTSTQDVLDIWLQVQSTWLYLEPIFCSDDIRRQMAKSGDKFSLVDSTWRMLMSSVLEDSAVLAVRKQENLMNILQEALHSLQEIQRGLDEYLNKKRVFFPNFYFLSNDELLEILSKTKDPKMVEPYLKRVFDKINRLEFSNSGEIVAVYSNSDERIPFYRKVDPKESKGMVELWLTEVSDCVTDSLKILLNDAIEENLDDISLDLIQKYPNQILISVILVQWTHQVEKVLAEKGDFEGLICKYESILLTVFNLIRSSTTKLLKANLSSISIFCMHLKSSTILLKALNVTSQRTSAWLSQLRGYIVDGLLRVRLGGAELPYGYEYTGSSQTPVLTSNVMKAIRHIYEAVTANKGILLYGDIGSGKTESIEVAAVFAGRSIMTYNASVQTNVEAFLNVLSGAIQTGSWLCVHGVDRIPFNVLSVITQTIENLFITLQKGMRRFVIGKMELCITGACAIIFTTSNWISFSKAAPDSFFATIITVGIRIEDSPSILQSIIMSKGFLNSEKLAARYFNFQRSLRKKLQLKSKKYQNDLSKARCIVNRTLRYLDDRFVIANQNSRDIDEEKCFSDCLKRMEISSCIGKEVETMQNLMIEYFPGFEALNETGEISEQLRNTIQNMGFQATTSFVDKLKQLLWLIETEHQIIIEGPPFSGKTSLIKVLQEYLMQQRKTEVSTQWIFWSAGNLGEILGKFKEQEWKDGLLTSCFRVPCRSGAQNWLILDCSLNSNFHSLETLFDNTRKYSLCSGEIIQAENEVKLFIETTGLDEAPTGTTSRLHHMKIPLDMISTNSLCCSFVYSLISKFQPKEMLHFSFSGEGSVSSAASGKDNEKREGRLKRELALAAKSHSSSDSDSIEHRKQKQGMLLKQIYETRDMFKYVLQPLLAFAVNNVPRHLDLPELLLTQNFLVLFENCLLPKANDEVVTDTWLHSSCLFSAIYTIGIYFKDIDIFTKKLKELVKLSPINFVVNLPEEGSLFDWTIDKGFEGKWISWISTSPFETILDDHVINTIIGIPSFCRLKFFFNRCVVNSRPLLVFGPPSSGKSTAVQYLLSQLNSDCYKFAVIQLTSAMTFDFLRREIISYLEKRRKGTYGPPLGKRFIFFLEDLQSIYPPFIGDKTMSEMLRMWLDRGMIFENFDGEVVELVDINLIVSLKLPNAIDPRILRFFDFTYMENIENENLSIICASILMNKWNSLSERRRLPSIYSRIICSVYRYFQNQSLKYPYSPNDIKRLLQSTISQDCQALSSTVNVDDLRQLHRLLLHEIQKTFLLRLPVNDTHQSVILSIFHQETEIEPCTVFEGQHSPSDANKLLKRLLFSVKSIDKGYEEIESYEEYAVRIEQCLEEARIKLIVSEALLVQASSIIRTLIHQQGHLVIIGPPNSGKKTSVRVAACLLRMNLFEIKKGTVVSESEWLSTLKLLLRLVGARGEKTCFLIDEKYLFDPMVCTSHIIMLMTYGEIPLLFSHEEKMELVELMHKQESLKEQEEDSTYALYNFFTERVKMNLHIVITSSESGWLCSNGVKLFPQLLPKATMYLWQPWEDSALVFAAGRLIEELEPNLSTLLLPDIKDSIILAILRIFRNSEIQTFGNALKTKINPSLGIFFDLISTFIRILKEKKRHLEVEKKRYLLGLELLNAASSQVEIQQQEMKTLQPVLMKISAETEVLMVKLEQEAMSVEAEREVVAADGAQANEAAALAQAIKDESESDLTDAIPALEAAVAALDTLRPPDITEIKSLKNPPSIVRLVMEAVCIMLSVKPVRIPDDSGFGRVYEDYWPSSLKLLGDMRFMERLQEYDRDRVDPEIINIIREKYLTNPEFDPDVVAQVSVACEGLCRWIQGVEVYDRVIHIVGPKKASLRESEKELARQMEILSKKHKQLTRVMDRLQNLNDDFAAMSRKKKDLENQIDQCTRKLKRSDKLIDGIQGERRKYDSKAKQIEDDIATVVGNALFAAASVCLAGHYSETERQTAFTAWNMIISDLGIDIQKDIKLTLFLTNKRTVRAWIVDGLAEDDQTTTTAIMALNAPKYPFFLDPHDHVKQWLQSVFKTSKQPLSVLNWSDSCWVEDLARLARIGSPVLVEFCESDIPSYLDDILINSRNSRMVQLGNQSVEIGRGFQLFFSSPLDYLTISAESVSKVTVFDFELTEQGIQCRLLSELCSVIDPRLESRRRELEDELNDLKKESLALEDRILDILQDPDINILQDETAIHMLYASKVLAERSLEKQKLALEEEKEIKEEREKYKPMARMAQALISSLKRLSNLNPMYHWGTELLFSVFRKAIRESWETSHSVFNTIKHFGLGLNTFVGQSIVDADKMGFAIMLAKEIQVLTSSMVPRSRQLEKDPVAAIFGQAFIAKKDKTMLRCFEYAGPNTPILLVVNDKGNPSKLVREAANLRKLKSADIHFVYLGEKQEKAATDAISICKAEGGWVVLIECHLMSHWISQILHLVINCQDLSQDFQLIISTRATNQFPMAILRKSLKFSI